MAQGVLSNRYRLEARIAKGGMGVVHRAYDEVLGRPVAVKVLAGDLGENPEFIERFRREARNAAMLLHANIAGIFDYGHDDGRWYMVMELVEGEDLAARLKRVGRLHWSEAFALGEHVAAALIHAHARGLVHRDVKPGNILICVDDTAKVTDFGIALAAQATTTLTQTGTALGTPNYMAPEQAKGEPVGPAADLYALGVVLFECTTGERPYQADSGIALAMQHVTAPVPDPRERGIELPGAVADVVTRCMAKRPADRFASAAALREALRSCRAGLATVPTVVTRGAAATTVGTPFVIKAAGATGSSAGPLAVPLLGGPWSQPAAGPAAEPAAEPAAAVETPPTAGFGPGHDPAQDGRRLPAVQPGVQPAALPPVQQPSPGAWQPHPEPVRQPDGAPPGAPSWQAGTGEPAGTRRGGSAVRTLALIGVGVALVVAAFLVGRAVGDGDGERGGGGRRGQVVDVRGRVPIGLVGGDYRDAQARLLAIGFPSSLETEHSETVQKDRVIRTFPDEGTERDPGESVTLYVSLGPTPKAAVPSGLIGKPYAEVRDRLRAEGFEVDRTDDYSNDYGKGRVVALRPGEGSIQERGQTVQITVSLGSGDVLVPTGIVGSDWRTARARLVRLGLTVQVHWEKSNERPRNSVLRVSPDEGNVARKDGLVTLTVSNGPGS